jgi:hypothetical protein
MARQFAKKNFASFRARRAQGGDIERLKQPRDIEEPLEDARRDDLHLDHDTKGLTGSPEAAPENLQQD